jgi:hypothetical protein
MLTKAIWSPAPDQDGQKSWSSSPFSSFVRLTRFEPSGSIE